MQESSQSEKKQTTFSVMYAVMMRQVPAKLPNMLRCIVPSVSSTIANRAHAVILGLKLQLAMFR